MKITTNYLRQVIKEELKAVLAEEETSEVHPPRVVEIHDIKMNDLVSGTATAKGERNNELGKFEFEGSIDENEEFQLPNNVEFTYSEPDNVKNKKLNLGDDQQKKELLDSFVEIVREN